MTPIEQEVINAVGANGDTCYDCGYYQRDCERGDYGESFCTYSCEAPDVLSCPGARTELEALLDEFDQDESDYLARFNPADPEGLFFAGYVLKFGGTYTEAQARAARFYVLSNLWSKS